MQNKIKPGSSPRIGGVKRPVILIPYEKRVFLSSAVLASCETLLHLNVFVCVIFYLPTKIARNSPLFPHLVPLPKKLRLEFSNNFSLLFLDG
jgi:hypothetical protein